MSAPTGSPPPAAPPSGAPAPIVGTGTPEPTTIGRAPAGTSGAVPTRGVGSIGPGNPSVGGGTTHGALPGHVSSSPFVEPGSEGAVSLTIDGKPVSVKKGTNVLLAARGMGIDIPYFCYHPGLSIAAACRQCLVEVTGQPKLAPSCQVTCADKMEVKTQTPKAVLARQQQLEFTLVNHPVDCPICDKAGECTLQRLYFDHDRSPTRSDVGKVAKPKAVDLGPTVVLDAERCILCSRCIRVCDEVAKTHQLEFAHRGDREMLTTAPGHQLDNPYSLNVVDVCPVGALTSKDFRFSMRAWELYTTASICNGCSTGCNMEIHHSRDRAHRLVPRENLAVNKYWMCDEGRMTYKDIAASRVASPWQRGKPSTWEKTLNTAKQRLDSIDKSQIGVVFSARATNEDNWLLGQIADFLGVTHRYLAATPPRPERADGILMSADVNPNTAGARLVTRGGARSVTELEGDIDAGTVTALIVLDQDVPLSEEGAADLKKCELSLCFASHTRGIAELCDSLLPVASWAETHGTIMNDKGITQRMRAAVDPPGEAVPRWEALHRFARALGLEQTLPTAKSVFVAMKAAVPELATAEWGREQPLVQLRWAGSRG